MNAIPIRLFSVFTAACFAVSITIGCQQTVAPETAAAPEETIAEQHDHPDHGPHDGDLIELGDGDYHGELLHDDKSLTIWILDGAAAETVAAGAGDAVVNGIYGDERQQFVLTPQPQDGDAEGMASCFVSDDATLLEWLERPIARLRISVSIDGAPWAGSIVHDHDHDHDH